MFAATVASSSPPPQPVDQPPSSNIGSPTPSSTQLNSQELCSSFENSLHWKVEDSEAPKVPEGFTMIAESKFSINVEEFFDLFFSDNAIGFMKSFRKKCGDKDFQCTSWHLHEQLGHSRDVSFQHPIKILIGPKFGSCKEVQKYRVYRNSHLIIETLQEVDDVPYGDYFKVEGLWDVERDNEMNNGCILRVYTNVAFSKRTMLKGKIVQSTVEESREVLAVWIELAHELLKQKNLEQGAAGLEQQGTTDRISKASLEVNDLASESFSPTPLDHQVLKTPQDGSSAFLAKFFRSLRGQRQVFSLLVITIASILILMQMSIVILLSSPRQNIFIQKVDYVSMIYKENGVYAPDFLDKEISNFKNKISMVETSLDKIQQEHAMLKIKLKELELYKKKKR